MIRYASRNPNNAISPRVPARVWTHDIPFFSRNLQFLCPVDETSKAQPNVALIKTNKLLHRTAEINECF